MARSAIPPIGYAAFVRDHFDGALPDCATDFSGGIRTHDLRNEGLYQTEVPKGLSPKGWIRTSVSPLNK